MNGYDNHPNDREPIDFVQTWFQWRIVALLCKVAAGAFVGLFGIFAIIAGGLFGQSAEMGVVWAMFAAPVALFVGACVYTLWPKETNHAKWLRQQAARPWGPEHAEPWKSANPVQLGQYAAQRTRVEPTFTLRR
ncbi:hypothetical protein [Acidisoma sp. L85]|uniref:hypothetical protein n=1 Tax=Acidisoma sp. L85 TaxID=1641850 RepID=UPI00131E3BD9|nr:hypothetical protein [Acidisoma sp. L85]